MKLFIVVLIAFVAQGVFASCSVKNGTKYNFSVTQGNVSNRSFGSNHVDSFPTGSFSGNDGKGHSFSATCNASESLEVTEQNGTIVVKKR